MTATAAFSNYSDLYDVSGFEARGVRRSDFGKALKAAEAAADPDQAKNASSNQDSIDAFYGSISASLERRSDKAQGMADELKMRSGQTKDPVKAEILAKRAEINEDRGENLSFNAELFETGTTPGWTGDNRLHNFYGNSSEALLENAAYHDERSTDLFELSELVREDGHEKWADKLLARSGLAKDLSEKMAEMAERKSGGVVQSSDAQSSDVQSSTAMNDQASIDAAVQADVDAALIEASNASRVSGGRDADSGGAANREVSGAESGSNEVDGNDTAGGSDAADTDADSTVVAADDENTDTDTVSGSGGLSAQARPETEAGSEDNQAALEARFVALYERLMEKQVSFKEAVEPFKTDNQNAGKG
jgi:hypothetical protein